MDHSKILTYYWRIPLYEANFDTINVEGFVDCGVVGGVAVVRAWFCCSLVQGKLWVGKRGKPGPRPPLHHAGTTRNLSNGVRPTLDLNIHLRKSCDGLMEKLDSRV